MTVNKLSYPAKENAVQEKINEIIDELGAATGANIDLSNLSATGEAHFQAPLVSGTNIKTVNNTSLLGSGNINVADTDLSNLSTTGQNIADTVKNQNTVSTRLKFWTGTQAQYDAIATKDSDTLYNVEDTTSPIISILDSLYPVGAIYIGTMSACPLATLGIGTWTLVSSGKVLQGVDTGQTVGTNISAGLPNITGTFAVRSAWNNGAAGGAFYVTSNQYQNADLETGSNNWRGEYGFDASRSSSIYGNSSTVQPPAYLVNIWERIA